MKVTRVVLFAAALGVGGGVASAGWLEPVEGLGVAKTATFVPGAAIADFGHIESLRHSAAARVVPGDTYGAAVLGQSAAGAGHITAAGRTTTFVYDEVASLHGNLVGSNAAVHIGEVTFPGPTGFQERYVVSAFTVDGSELYLSGLELGGQPVDQARFDVGGGFTTNGILADVAFFGQPVASVSIFSVLFIDGTVVGVSGALSNLRVLPAVGSAVVWSGVTGSAVDEIALVFDITYVPEPAALGLLVPAGMLLARRRRA